MVVSICRVSSRSRPLDRVAGFFRRFAPELAVLAMLVNETRAEIHGVSRDRGIIFVELSLTGLGNQPCQQKHVETCGPAQLRAECVDPSDPFNVFPASTGQQFQKFCVEWRDSGFRYPG